jgi:5,10-methylenetetrahydromethanopterin reductase
MTPKISCAFATSLTTADHVVEAEQLGYHRAWLYDSPALYPDVWMVLGSVAQRTSTIGIGPAVLVPSLRHPMVNAAAIAGLEAWAPGRVAVAIGSGFTGRLALGQRPLPWSQVADYVRTVRALLRGEAVDWEGSRIQMLHGAAWAPPRPIDVPFLIGADGPKGVAVAREHGDGIFGAGTPDPEDTHLTWRAQMAFGTVLAEGEELSSERAKDALAPSLAAAYHALYERNGAAVEALPGGAAWRESIEQVSADERHLAVHEGHLVAPNRHDLLALDEGIHAAPAFTLTGTAAEVRARVEALAATGITEVVYQPAGPDIVGELRSFIAATA